MLQVVLLPTTLDAAAADTATTFDDVSERLRSTLRGLKKPAPLRTPTSMLPSTAEEHPLPFGDFETSFARDVLELEYGDTEDALDERLRIIAQELGLHAEALRLSKEDAKAASTNTFGSSDVVRRSGSIGSRASRSTGLTSNFSDFCNRDPASLRSRKKDSLSFRDYDSFLSRGSLSERRDSMSFTPPLTPSRSSLSLALSSPSEASPKKHFRKLRGLSMLKLNRNGSDSSLPLDGCPHCPQNAFSQRRAIHRLPCGHRLCTQSLRNTINAGTQGPLGSVPSCCGTPIPGRLVEQVMTHDEQTALLDKLSQWDEATSTTPSTRSRPTNTPHHPLQTPHPPPTTLPLSTATHLPGFPAHRAAQTLQRARYQTWSTAQTHHLHTAHATALTALQHRHATALADLQTAHATALADAEDAQVQAEADLLAAHAREARDLATALRHMEAYCAGTLGCGAPHGRTVTEQDLRELGKARAARAGLPGRHEGAVRVLRGEQGRRLKGRVKRQEREVGNLVRAHGGEVEGLERGFGVLVRGVEGKREGLVRRWEVQDAVFLRRLEVEGRLPGVEWGDELDDDDAVDGVRGRSDSRVG